MMDTEGIALQRRQVLQNYVAMLQTEPLYYRNFGVYWYRFKQILRAAGFNQDHATILGDYVEEDLVERFKDMDEETFLPLAMEEAMANWQLNDQSQWQADPDGGYVFTLDQDLGR